MFYIIIIEYAACFTNDLFKPSVHKKKTVYNFKSSYIIVVEKKRISRFTTKSYFKPIIAK